MLWDVEDLWDSDKAMQHCKRQRKDICRSLGAAAVMTPRGHHPAPRKPRARNEILRPFGSSFFQKQF